MKASIGKGDGMATLSELVGPNLTWCGHSIENMGGMQIFIHRGEPEDLQHLKDTLGLDPTVTAVSICRNCRDTLPSEIEKQVKHQVAKAKSVALAEAEREEKLQLLDEGLMLYKCFGCDSLWLEEDVVQVRYCSHCEENFNGTDNGRNCESCNRPFTSKLVEQGCQDCLDEDGCTSIHSRNDLVS
jgi:hypothetical protein